MSVPAALSARSARHGCASSAEQGGFDLLLPCAAGVRDLADALAVPVAADEIGAALPCQLPQKVVEHTGKFLPLEGRGGGILRRQTALQLLKGYRQVAAALGGFVIVAAIQRHAPDNAGDIRRQTAGPLRRDGVPQPQPHIGDALLRVPPVRQDAAGRRQALFPVSGLRGLQCRRIAAEKQVDDLYVLQGALPPSANGVSLHLTTPGGKTPAEPLRQNAAPAVYDGAGRRGVAVFSGRQAAGRSSRRGNWPAPSGGYGR